MSTENAGGDASCSDTSAFGYRLVDRQSLPLKRPPPEQKEGQSPDEEVQEYLRYLKLEQCPLDDVGEAICEAGIGAGYKRYLEKAHKYHMVLAPRTWADDPNSEEYHERERAFCANVLWKLRKMRAGKFKGYGAGPFEDTFDHEEPPTGLLTNKQAALVKQPRL